MAKRKLKYYKNLDGLRGIAALSVVVFHFFYDSRLINSLQDVDFAQKLTEILQHGVTLFFVLSGFVITRILLNTRKSSNYFSEFYKRRALRIFPLYYGYLVIHFYIFPWLVDGAPNLEFEKQVSMYLYLQNMSWLTGWEVIGPGQFWSLAVEEHFYLVWPFIIMVTPRRHMLKVIVGLVILSIPLKIWFMEHGIEINKNTFSRYDSIMLGAILAVLEKKRAFKLVPLHWLQTFTFFLLILVFGSVLYYFQDLVPLLKASSKHLILGLFFAMLIYYLIADQSNRFIDSFLESSTLQYLGKISYGIYVWHLLSFEINSLFAFDNFWANLFTSVTITIMLAHLSFYYFERYFFRFK